ILRNYGAFRNDGMSGDYRVCPDLCSVHHRRVYSNETIIPDLRAVDRHMMGDRTVVADDCGCVVSYMNHHEVLDVGSLSNADLMHLTSYNDIGPERCSLVDEDLAVDYRRIMDESGIIQNDIRVEIMHLIFL